MSLLAKQDCHNGTSQVCDHLYMIHLQGPYRFKSKVMPKVLQLAMSSSRTSVQEHLFVLKWRNFQNSIATSVHGMKSPFNSPATLDQKFCIQASAANDLYFSLQICFALLCLAIPPSTMPLAGQSPLPNPENSKSPAKNEPWMSISREHGSHAYRANIDYNSRRQASTLYPT